MTLEMLPSDAYYVEYSTSLPPQLLTLRIVPSFVVNSDLITELVVNGRIDEPVLVKTAGGGGPLWYECYEGGTKCTRSGSELNHYDLRPGQSVIVCEPVSVHSM